MTTCRRCAALGLLLALASAAGAQGSNSSKDGLPPRPPSVTSQWLSTEIAGFGVEKEGEAFVARYSISLVPVAKLAADVFLEIKFENPANKAEPFVVTQLMKKDDERAMLGSPAITSMKCGLYRAEVNIYDSDKKEKLLGVHTQMVRSTYDLSKVKKQKDLESPSKC